MGEYKMNAKQKKTPKLELSDTRQESKFPIWNWDDTIAELRCQEPH